MTKLTFMHTGDEHLDATTHGTLNATTGRNTLWESNQAVMSHLVTVAIERRVDAFISAGDSFKNGAPSQEALLMFADAYAPLGEAGIPLVILDGNHNRNGVPSDHRSAIHVLAQMLRARGTTVHVVSDPQLVRLDNGLQVAALPWMSKNQILSDLGKLDAKHEESDRIVSDHGLETLTKLTAEADSTSPLIIASHVTVDDLRLDAVTEGFKRGSEVDAAHLFSEPVLDRKKLEQLPFSYGALSHIHTPQKVGAKLWYAGSPNRLTFTDMRDAKGGNLVTVDSDGTFTVERIATPARVMTSIDLDDEAHTTELAALEAGTLVQLHLATGEPEVPRSIRKAIASAGAILADTKPRPKPREVTAPRVSIPEKTDPQDALRTWAMHELPAHINLDHLLSAAENLTVDGGKK